MKNVAKCDTWCELQNPVNHRVFERKLRPKPPLGAEGTPAWVSRNVAKHPFTFTPFVRGSIEGWRILASRGQYLAVGLKESPPARRPRRAVVESACSSRTPSWAILIEGEAKGPDAE